MRTLQLRLFGGLIIAFGLLAWWGFRSPQIPTLGTQPSSENSDLANSLPPNHNVVIAPSQPVQGKGVNAIPLGNVYTNIGQEGVKPLPFYRSEESRQECDGLTAHFIKSGVPVAFVVKGWTIDDALVNTRNIVLNNRAVSPVFLPGELNPRAHLWIFLFLGNSSSGSDKEILAINTSHDACDIIVQNKRNISTGTTYTHLAWVPISIRPEANTYTVRVVEKSPEGESEIAFSRQVQLEKR